MGLAEATKVRVEQKTSSPEETPRRRSARWSAAVPLDKHTQGSPTRSVNDCSKASRFGPAVETQLRSKASPAYPRSELPMWGTERKILFTGLFSRAIQAGLKRKSQYRSVL